MYCLNCHFSLKLILGALGTGIEGRIRRIFHRLLILIELVVEKCLGCGIRINRLIYNPRHPSIILIIFRLQIIIVLLLLIWPLELHWLWVILIIILHLICNLLTWIKIRILKLVAILYSNMILTVHLLIQLESNSWV